MAEGEGAPKGFEKVSFESLEWKPFEAFSSDWMALAAGNEASFNTMTVAWGQMGSLLGKSAGWGNYPVATVYVRPQRYTNEFMKREGLFSLSYFGKEQRKALGILGSKSGRDCDKVGEAGLTPVFCDDTVFFGEARLVLVCRKIYTGTLREKGFVDKSIALANYPDKDFHDIYIGEVTKAYRAQEGMREAS